MNIKKKGLNRGLDALLAGTTHKINNKNTAKDNNINNNLNLITDLNIQQLTAGRFQPRKIFQPEELSELVTSIKNQGILQPLIVRKLDLEKDNYEIIAGERRFRAATLAGLTEVPVIIKNVNDQDALTIALIENIQRENLNPVEEAIALDRLIKEFSLTHNEIATAVGKSRTVITNLLRILQLPHEIKQMLENNQLDLGHAKVLAGAPYEMQLKIANNIIESNLSVRATEELLKKSQTKNNFDFNRQEINNKSNKNKLYNKQYLDPDLSSLQRKLSEMLGAKTTIEALNKNGSGKGKLIIEYNSLEELNGILEHFESKLLI